MQLAVALTLAIMSVFLFHRSLLHEPKPSIAEAIVGLAFALWLLTAAAWIWSLPVP